MTGADWPRWCLGVESISGDSSSCHVAVPGVGNKGSWHPRDVNRTSYIPRRVAEAGNERPVPDVRLRDSRDLDLVLGAVGGTR